MYRPTSLRIFTESCPAALKFFTEDESGAAAGQNRMDDYSRAETEIEGNEMAEVGIAFHACVHAAALAEKQGKPRQSAVEATALALTHKMNAMRAREGADMAQEFIFYREFDTRLDYEHGLSFDKKWKPIGWDHPERRLRMVLDAYGVVDVDDPERGEMKVAQSADYKTGWGANKEILDGVQALCHSTALYELHKDDVDMIKIEIIATRLHRVFVKEWSLHEEADVIDLQKRKARLEFIMNAASTTDFAPRLGLGCGLCDFKEKCGAFQTRLKELRNDPCANPMTHPKQAAIDLVILETKADEIKKILKEMCKTGSIDVGEEVLGYVASESREFTKATEFVDMWFQKAGNPQTAEDAIRITRGLVKTAKLGVGQFDNLAKALSKVLGYKTQTICIEELGNIYCEKQAKSTFKFHKPVAVDK